MINFCIRNISIFLSDKMAVLLSFFSEFIVLLLYTLFLRDNLLAEMDYAHCSYELMDMWMFAGMMGIAPVNVCMSVYSIMAEDQSSGIYKDIYASPLPNLGITGGYFMSAAVLAWIMNLVIFIAGGIYMRQCYDVVFSVYTVMSVLSINAVIVLSSAAITMLIASFIRTTGVMAAWCTILGALIGFVTGIYIPIGNMHECVQGFVKMVPATHGVSLLRRTLMDPGIQNGFSEMPESFANGSMGYTATAEQFRICMGVDIEGNAGLIKSELSLFYLIFSAIAGLGLSLIYLNYRRNPPCLSKRKISRRRT